MQWKRHLGRTSVWKELVHVRNARDGVYIDTHHFKYEEETADRLAIKASSDGRGACAVDRNVWIRDAAVENEHVSVPRASAEHYNASIVE